MPTLKPKQKAALYFRVSTADQSTTMQKLDLRRYAKARGLTVYQEYCDEGISGAKVKRPALDRLMEDARRRLFDVVLVWRFDRFARSVIHLVTALKEFQHLKIDFISYNEQIDTSSPMGAAMFTIGAAFAELEHRVIKERVTAGVRQAIKKRRAKAPHTVCWGPRPVEQVDPAIGATIRELRKEGLGCHRIGKRLGLSSRTVWKVVQRASVTA
ncbi:MAG: recombinase family protein [Chloroflexota bacterium]